jgi:CBS domain-containing membrane protein
MVARVIAVNPEDSLVHVVEIMSKNRVSGVPVVNSDRRVLGVISEKDILRQMVGETTDNFMALLAQCLRSGGRCAMPGQKLIAREVMTEPAVTIQEDVYLADIAELLTQRQINRLPVTDPDGRLVGIITRSDIVNATLRNGTCTWTI